ncbi:hypothetical protein BT69DRAFT_1347543 [Atractiella rhizophila]|nr:hypothetical protein BT69DRAFT_1347543 [Atractiella rhizophila]
MLAQQPHKRVNFKPPVVKTAQAGWTEFGMPVFYTYHTLEELGLEVKREVIEDVRWEEEREEEPEEEEQNVVEAIQYVLEATKPEEFKRLSRSTTYLHNRSKSSISPSTRTTGGFRNALGVIQTSNVTLR